MNSINDTEDSENLENLKNFKNSLEIIINDENNKIFLKNHNFGINLDIKEWKLTGLNVIVGLNGCGKTNFLKLIREIVVEKLNSLKPKYVVRLLSFGRESENYDPEKINHPLVDSY
jgi:ABC-type polysaccharide/polyol phosphate transport system ATPase subunit